METRIAVIGIIIENMDSVEAVNGILHQYGSYIIGRMGLPYPKKQVNIISVVVDAPQDIISAISGKIGRLPGISCKALHSKMS
ncbi:MAG: iron-only hydrogenase system regulator [Clostridiaceae bacterium]|nr:iron-only hydrogenase system regulator [Clostridiaceae bacterium]